MLLLLASVSGDDRILRRTYLEGLKGWKIGIEVRGEANGLCNLINCNPILRAKLLKLFYGRSLARHKETILSQLIKSLMDSFKKMFH